MNSTHTINSMAFHHCPVSYRATSQTKRPICLRSCLLDIPTAPDMKDHPNCRYSMSSQKECTSTNGDYACETIRRVFRNCPGFSPKQVYDVTTRDTGTVPKSPGDDDSGGGGGGGGMPVPGVRSSQQVRHRSKQSTTNAQCLFNKE